MAPSTISAAAGGIEKVNGTSTATAIVAVRPGSAPITVPATTPASASSRWAGVSAAEALALLDAFPALELHWDGDAPTSLTIEAAPAGATACGRIDSNGLAAPLHFDVAVTMQSEDGRLDGALILRADANLDAEGELSELSIRRDAAYGDYASIADFEDAFGVHGVDLSGYDGGGITFDLTCSADGHHGAITVLAAEAHECSDEPGEPCEGTDMIELVGGTWSSAQ